MSARDGMDPAHPERWTHARMHGHILQKGFQAGSIIGGMLVSPALMFWKGKPDWNVLFKTSGQGAAVGVVLTGLLGFAKLAGEPREAIEDRVYRLYYNEGQNRVDSFAQAGMAAGLVFAVASRGRASKPLSAEPWELVGHAALGAAAGVFAHIITAPKKPSIDMKSVSDSIDKMK